MAVQARDVWISSPTHHMPSILSLKCFMATKGLKGYRDSFLRHVQESSNRHVLGLGSLCLIHTYTELCCAQGQALLALTEDVMTPRTIAPSGDMKNCVPVWQADTAARAELAAAYADVAAAYDPALELAVVQLPVLPIAAELTA